MLQFRLRLRFSSLKLNDLPSLSSSPKQLATPFCLVASRHTLPGSAFPSLSQSAVVAWPLALYQLFISLVAVNGGTLRSCGRQLMGASLNFFA